MRGAAESSTVDIKLGAGRRGPVFVNSPYCRNYGLAGPNPVFWPFLRSGLPGRLCQPQEEEIRP